MTIVYELQRKDYVDFVLARADRLRIRRWQWLLLLGLLVAVALLAGLLSMAFGGTGWLDEVPMLRPLFYAIGAVLALMALLLAVAAAIRAAVGRLPTPGSLPGHHELSVTNEGIEDRYAAGGASVAWSDITEVRETAEAVGFIVGRADIRVIPRRAFLSEDRYREFMRAVAAGRGTAPRNAAG